tara:strand:+ start:183 stop:425 length:243 start_codon:yes stop_codon:yes gene_type:complete
MCDTTGVLTLDDLFDGTISLDGLNQQNDCSGCTNSCQKKQTVEIVEVVAKVKVKSKCCKRYERKKKAPCKGCPERTRAAA